MAIGSRRILDCVLPACGAASTVRIEARALQRERSCATKIILAADAAHDLSVFKGRPEITAPPSKVALIALFDEGGRQHGLAGLGIFIVIDLVGEGDRHHPLDPRDSGLGVISTQTRE